MNADAPAPRGLYFEDFEIGQRYFTPRRTVTQTDIVNYACLSGDFNAPHVDFEFCRQQPYKEPIAHGPIVFAIATGLQCLSGINDGTIVAFLGMDEWRINTPVKHGDTIYMVMTPTEKRLTSKGGRGVVTLRREIMNTQGEVVQTMVTRSLYLCRPERVGTS
jgi:acyl dehydratase